MKTDETKIPVTGANHSGDREEKNYQTKFTNNITSRQEQFGVFTITRRWFKALLVWLACQGALPDYLAGLLSGGLRHD